jgi:hypothetical protein
MSKQLNTMQKTRTAVWAKYIESILDQRPSKEVLCHVIGGYGLRLKWHDFRYKHIQILEESLKKLMMINEKAKFSQKISLILYQNINHILKYIPKPRTTSEKY